MLQLQLARHQLELLNLAANPGEASLEAIPDGVDRLDGVFRKDACGVPAFDELAQVNLDVGRY